MTDRGVRMIDEIQGPPLWEGPDVLLRQTSFRALAEPRRFREANGRITRGELRVRFGEVQARGIALTPRAATGTTGSSPRWTGARPRPPVGRGRRSPPRCGPPGCPTPRPS